MRAFATRFVLTASAATIAIAAMPAAAGAQQTAQPGRDPVQDVLPRSDVDPNLPPDGTTRAQEEGGAIVVTGSRIRSPQYTQPNPIISIDSSDIQNAGTTNLVDFLTENPALQGSTTSNDTSGTNAGIGAVGLNLLNLRNLGTQRTLVLVDGRRHVAAVPGSASIDIQTIPVDLIERVDVVTGAAGAVYGADAVTGVVNFVLRRDFEGLAMRAQGGISEYGDNGRQFVSLTAGSNFAGGRGNVALALEYGHDEAFGRLTRRFLTPQGLCGFYRNQADIPDNPNVPDNLLECDVRYFDSRADSAVDIDLDTVPDFEGSGAPWQFGRFVGSIFEVGGSGTPVATYSGDLLPEVTRYVGNLLLSYNVTDSIRFYAQAKYARVEAQTENQPSFDFFLRVNLDNAFLPANVRQGAIDAGVPFILITGRDNFDLGRRGSTATRDTYRGVVGFTAELNENIRADVSYVYGRTDNDTFQTNYRFNDRFFAAIDAVRDPATGNIVCRSNIANPNLSNQPFIGSGGFNFSNPTSSGIPVGLSFTPGANSGCVPLNPFIAFNNNTTQGQAAINWINTTANDLSRIEQHVASAVIDGNLGGFRLWGGPIGFAVGAEYRHESSSNQPDPVGLNFATFGNRLAPTVGEYDVREVFGELRVPIIADRPFFNELTVNGAARYSDYSTVGDTFTWQVGGIYSPIRDLRLRATYAQAVRAPNIAELFGGQSQTFAFFNDPCAPQNLNSGTALRATNCQAILQERGLSPAQIAAFTGALSSSVPGLAGGNPNLDEETARTFTAGGVLQPRFIPRLSLSVDYYDVEIRNAVSTPTAQTIAVLCVDQPRPNVYCSAITRAGPGETRPGVITGFQLQPQNVASFRTSGIDFAANYRLDAGRIGTFNFRLVGNHLLSFTTIPVPGGNQVNSRGTVDVPEWTVNFNTTWVIDQLALTWRVNYFSETLRFSRQAVETNPDIVESQYLYFDERFTHDFQANFRVNDRMGFYLGVNNAFGQLPDVGATYYPVPATGRFFYAGARLNFGSLRF